MTAGQLLIPVPGPCCIYAPLHAAEKPNVLLIVCEALNDYVENIGSHPQARPSI